jgi:hypothetical protein
MKFFFRTKRKLKESIEKFFKVKIKDISGAIQLDNFWHLFSVLFIQIISASRDDVLQRKRQRWQQQET